ncbi:MAG: hypothetical protein AB8D52_05130 [Gammaproteobacteria bacterium]
MSFQKYIDSILDTPNVEGLLLFDCEGKVHFQQVPDYADETSLAKLPLRILMMYDVIADNTQNCCDFILKFEKKNFYFRKSHNKKNGDFILAIVSNAGVNFVALKLITNLAIKMIELSDSNSLDKNNKKRKKIRPALTQKGRTLARNKKLS